MKRRAECWHRRSDVVGKDASAKKRLDNFDLEVLRRTVYSFFHRNEFAIVSKLTRHFEEDSELLSVSTATMHRTLKKLGFQYRKWSQNALPIEAPHIVQSHCRYLHQIAELWCQCRPIFYTDETWVNTGHTSRQVWVYETTDTIHKVH